MKVMSFNCRGLAGPKKKSALIRVLTLEHPDMILLQETLGEGFIIKERLENWLSGWFFVTMDVKGRSGGLAVGWKSSAMKVLTAWGMESVLGVELMSVDLGISLKVINIYGPYLNRITFWQRGIVYLSQLSDPRPDEPWIQHWRRAHSFGLEPHVAEALNLYINELVQAHIHLIDQEDELIWDMDPNGRYTPKARYIKLSSLDEQREIEWWWRPLWKIKCPAKVKIFMWSAMEGKVPTWDILQKRNFNGPGWCVLCKRAQESITHLFISCSFAVEVWKYCSSLVGGNLRWEGDLVGRAWDSWWRRTPLTKHKFLPLLVIWGIWLARNKAIFHDKPSLPEHIGALAVGIFNSFPEHVRAAKQRRDLVVEIDRSVPWGFFDGAAQHNRCGGGALLYLSDSHFFVLSFGMGEGSNNYAELMSLKLLLIFAVEKGCLKLNVFGDSMNVINWISMTQECRNMRLDILISSVRMVLQSIDSFSCRHVYRENNQEADLASKEGLQMALGT